MQNPQSYQTVKFNQRISSVAGERANQGIYKPTSSNRGSYIPSYQTYVQPKSVLRVYFIMLILCMGPFFAGVCIFLSFNASYNSYMKYYNFYYDQNVFNALMSAILPGGGALGAMLLPIAVRFFGKMNMITVFLIGTIVFAGLTLIPVFEVMLVARFFLGIIACWENVLTTLLIRDFAPMQYRAIYRGFYFTARTCGLTLSLFVGAFFLDQTLDTLGMCLVNLLPVYVIVVHFILFKIFIRQNPAMLVISDKSKLRPYFSALYHEKDVDIAVQNCIRQFQFVEQMHSYVNKDKGETEKQQATKIYNRLIAIVIVLSCQVSFLRQLCGINYVSPYSYWVFKNLNFPHANFGPTIMNSFLICFSLGGVYLCHRYQRKTLMIIGTAGCLVGMFTMAMTVYFEHYAGVLVGECIFLIFDGFFLQPTCWSYPPEINTLKTLPFSNLISWGSGTIIGSIAVVSRPYPILFFFTSVIFVNFIGFFFTARQVKNMTFRQVLTQVMQQAYAQLRNRPAEGPFTFRPFSHLKQDLLKAQTNSNSNGQQLITRRSSINAPQMNL